MSALNSTLTNGRMHQQNRNKRCGQGWGHPTQTLNKSQKCTWWGDRGIGIQFSLSLSWVVSCLTQEMCLESSVKTASFLTCPREGGPQTASQGREGLGSTGRVLGRLSSAKEWECLSHSHHLMSLPSKRALEEKPITVRCCSGTDLKGEEHGTLLLPRWLGFPRALGYVPVSSCSHLVLFSRGMREIVYVPMLVGVVTGVTVRLPLFSWVLEKLTSQ